MKNWYLIGSTQPTMLGGFEDAYHSDFKNDAFSEALQTDIGTTVVLYNYDLSISRVIRCVIDGNVADTQLKSMERTILVPIGTLRSGDYIFFEDEYWIVDGRPGNNKTYEKATLKECQYKLRWQKDDGSIIERWANLASASKYDVGEGGNNVIILGSNNFSIIIPHDEDSLTIDGKRVFIDSSNNPTKVFKITRDDDVLFLHGSHGGTLNLIADKVELNLEKDRPDLRICNYIDVSKPNNEESIDELKNLPNIKISGNNKLKVGYSRTYKANFRKDDIDNKWDNSYSWAIISDCKIDYKVSENNVELFTSNKNYIDSNITLQVKRNNIVLDQMEIIIVDIL